MVWLSADSETPIFAAAFVKLRSRPIATKARRSSKLRGSKFDLGGAVSAQMENILGKCSPEWDAMMTRRHMLSATGGFAALAAGRAGAETDDTKRRRNGTMDIIRNGSQPSRKGQAEYFTGAVRIDPLFAAPDPARASAGRVTFEPGARTAWHTHPLGQMLIIVSGFGWVQREGGRIEEVRPGDVVWFPSGLKHWHGATPTTAMTHIAIQESLSGKNVDWLEKVSDEQYRRA
jgi:quercetin dioxygenase-like cupin family protein